MLDQGAWHVESGDGNDKDPQDQFLASLASKSWTGPN